MGRTHRAGQIPGKLHVIRRRDGSRREEIMGTRLFVGNLPFGVTEDELREVFAKHGAVNDCHIVMDRESGRSKGFGFVEMTSNDDATKAIAATNDTDLGGRQLKVSEARPRAERSGGGGGGGGRW